MSNPTFPMRFTMPIPPKSIPDQKGIFVAHRTAVHGSRQNEFWPVLAQGHFSQIFVCHRRYPSLTQNAKPTSSNVFHHADSTHIDSRSKWTLFCAPRHARAWTTSVLATPWPFQRNMGMSPGLPQFDPECQTHLFQRFSPCRFHPNPFPVKMDSFLRATLRARLDNISSCQPNPGPFRQFGSRGTVVFLGGLVGPLLFADRFF